MVLRLLPLLHHDAGGVPMTSALLAAVLCATPLPIVEGKAFKYREDSAYWKVRAGDNGMQLAVFVTGESGVATLLDASNYEGWTLMDAETSDGQYPAIVDTEPTNRIWLMDVPAGKTVKLLIQFHGGPDPERAIKAAKDGKGVKIWKH
jgi:myo-inositol catabolism protein IolC